MTPNSGYYEEIDGRITALLIMLEEQLTPSACGNVQDYLDQNELGLALETLADDLSENSVRISHDARNQMLGLAGQMKLGDRVESALSLCPSTSTLISPSLDVVAALRDSLKTAADIFARYRLRYGFVDRCSPVAARKDVAERIVRTDPAVALDDLAYYEFKALSTMGDIEDLKHFLPAIFTAMVDGIEGRNDWFRLGCGSHADIFSKVVRSETTNWPVHEANALRDFVIRYWACILGTYWSPYPPLEYISNVHQIVEPAELLTTWHVGAAEGLHLAAARVESTTLDSELADWLHADDQLELILDSASLPGSGEPRIAAEYDRLLNFL